MSFASEDLNVTSAEVEDYELDVADEALNQNSYYSENNNSVEDPLLDDSFSNPKISYTERNTFYVNSSYYGSSELGTVSNPFKDINSAFSSLTFNRSVVNIYVASGTYKISKTITLNKNLNIIGENPLNTIISGKNTTGIFEVGKDNLAINMINLTFTQGNTYYGGAICNNRSTIKLINTIFNQNYATGYSSIQVNYSAAGAALYNEAGVYKIYNATFINNVARSSLNVYAAAIYNDMGKVSILNSKFINNTVDDANYGSGGAIYNFNGFLTICNSNFENNVIKSNYSIGGAIYNYEAHNVYVIDSTFDSNMIEGKYAFGSAIANSAVLLDVVNSTFTNNIANGIAPKDTTIFNINGFYNLINSTMMNNSISITEDNMLMCLEDQFVISRPFDDTLIDNLPSKYDLRDYGLVTYAKNQGSSGACWAFSTIAALESFLLKNENVSYDISENNLKNLMNNGGINGTDWGDGGNYQMALAYFLRWDGPVDEDDDSFSAYSVIPNYDLDPLKHVQGAMYLPMRLGYLDINQIKLAIMKYGALYTSVFGTSMTKNLYNSVSEIPNHAVAIVGWDDNYAASKFLGTKPPANGAFIIKNSWGPSYGDKGFGYVSYYDETFAGFSLDSLSAMAFTDVENVTNYRDIYQYDMLGNTYESLGFASNVAWLANQFTAKSNNPLSAFGVYSYGASDYLADIYVNGELKYTQEGKIDYAGFHTIKLNQLVDLVKGDNFRINLKLNTYDSIFPIAIESSRNGYSSKATADLNQSFVSADGVNWIDIAQDLEMLKISGCFYNKTLEQANVCLKAYTSNIGDLTLNISSSSDYFFKDDEIVFSFNLTNVGDYVKNISISFDLDDVVDIIGADTAKGNFNNGIWNVADLGNMESSILNLTVKILQNKDSIKNTAVIYCLDDIRNKNESVDFNLTYGGFTSFVVENVTSFSKSGDMVNFTLVDSFAAPVANADIIVQLNGQNITLKSDENGSVKFSLDLLEGSYQCDIYFNGNEIYKRTSQNFTVNVIKRNSKFVFVNEKQYCYPDGPSVIVVDEKNVTLENRSIIFTSKNDTYCNLAGLKAGNYSVLASFEGDDLYYECNAVINFTIIKKDTILTSKNLSTYAIVAKVDGKTGQYLKVTLKDDNSSLLSNKSISIVLNSKTYNVITNEKGIASLQINFAKSGTYAAKINFLGDEYYGKSTTTAKVTVKKKKMTLKVPKKSYKSSVKAKKLSATLKDNKGKAISSKKIIFKVNGKKYSAKTNKKGIATVKVKVSKKKTFTVTATFNGDSSYGKVTKKSKLIIK